MSKLLYKKRIKREVKNHIKDRVVQNISDKIPEIKNILTTSFYILEDIAVTGESILDLAPFKELFIARVEEFVFIPEATSVFTFKVPNVTNFDFTGMEFIGAVCEGIVGSFAEATAIDMLKLYGTLEGYTPINSGLLSPPVYLIPITEWLVDQEKNVLGYTLNKSPFSETGPLAELIFGPAEQYFNDNVGEWISQVISSSLDGAVTVYGGK